MAKKILYTVLNWGMGHATRSSMVIDLLLAQNCEITIYSDGIAYDLLKKRYPNLEFIKGADLDVNYSKLNFFQHLKLLLQLFSWKRKDIARIQNLLAHREFDVLINDARYAVLPGSIKVNESILINHQLRPFWPFGKVLAQSALDAWMQAYDRIWVPDDEHLNLSGRLSENANFNEKIECVGFLSQFHDLDLPQVQKEKSINLLSGPSKNRVADNQRATAVGLSGKEELNKIALLSTLSAERVYCKSGYSSIMDMLFIGRRPIVAPTKGQSEQEYLYQRSLKLGLAYSKELEGNEFIATPYSNKVLSQKIKDLC